MLYWVSVLYNDHWWFGIVESINNDYLYIVFIKLVGINMFIWPSIPEKDKILKKSILIRLENSPNPIKSSDIFPYHPMKLKR